MAFRYINPGYAALLDSDCTAEEVTGTTYSKTGVGFYQQGVGKGVTIPNFADGDDFWAKFDVYISSGGREYICCCRPNSISRQGVRVYCVPSNDDYYIYYTYQNGRTTSITNGKAAAFGINVDDINSFLIHMSQGNYATGLLEFFINGKKIVEGNYEFGYSVNYPKTAMLWTEDNHGAFSNVIFSNTEILPTEKIIALPTNTTVTDMAAGASGIYLASAANQSLLQTPDVATLIENYGETSKVTGIAVVGNPAYRTGTAITSLIGLSKSGGVITEHDTCELSEDMTATVMDGWSLSGVTIADLQNMQFGWKAGE